LQLFDPGDYTQAMIQRRDILVVSDRVNAKRLHEVLASIDVVAELVGVSRLPSARAGDDRLRLEEAPVSVAAAPHGPSLRTSGLPTSSSPTLANTIVIPADPPGSLELWIASTVARRLRRVPDADACGRAAVEDVLNAGRWLHPDAAALADEETQGVLVVKPSVGATPAFIRDIVERAAECGYAVVEARAVAAAEVRDRGLARAHYHSHCAFAERGGLSPAERAALLRIYGTSEFEGLYGRPAAAVPVVPVERFLAESGTPREIIQDWSDTSTAARGLDSGALDGPNELGDDKYVNLFTDPRWTAGGAVFLINPHMPSVLAWWESSPSPRVALLLARKSAHALSWTRLREEFCGASDGARARPGSIRRDGLEGVLPVPVEPGEAVDRTRNVIHLSNGPIEVLRETALWFERPVHEQSAARPLMAATGLDAKALLERSLLAVDGTVRPFTGATAGLTVLETVARINRGRVLPAEALICTPATSRRIDAAHAMVPALLADAPVKAVLVTASTARNRASHDSDVDLVVVADPMEHRIERRRAGPFLLECEWMDGERVRWVAAGGGRRDLKGLREASRLAHAIAVYDPDGLAVELEAASREIVPSHEEVDGRLIPAVEALDALIESSAEPGFFQWEILRGILDTFAVVLLLLHPIRYQKPKWVIADLREIGREELAEMLLRGYASTDDAVAAGRTLGAVEELLGRIAAAHDLPTFDAILAHGFVEQFPGWSYACRTLADAGSLLQDGERAAADYCGKFAARIGLRLDADLLADPGAAQAVGTEAPQSRGSAYRSLFSIDLVVAPPTDDDLELCATWAQHVTDARERVLGA